MNTNSTRLEVAWRHGKRSCHIWLGALDSLSDSDREAVLLRFYQQASHQQVAATLRTSEDGARKRVDRSLEKLRRFFAKKGVS